MSDGKKGRNFGSRQARFKYLLQRSGLIWREAGQEISGCLIRKPASPDEFVTVCWSDLRSSLITFQTSDWS